MVEVFAFPASFAQERIWFLEKLVPGTAAFNVPGAVRLGGELDRGRLFRAFRQVASRHESLRTTLAEENGELLQLVAEEKWPQLSLIDLSALDETSREIELARLTNEQAQASFALDAGPLFRAAVIAAGPLDHLVSVTLHHLISDGTSMSILMQELLSLYCGNTLPEPSLQYGDYAQWQRDRSATSEAQEALKRWLRELASPPEPARRSKTGGLSPGATFRFRLDGARVSALRELARKHETTLSTVLLSALFTLLHRSSGRDDLIVGVAVNGRTRLELEGVIGNFVNTVALRLPIDPTATLAEHLSATHRAAFRAYADREVPFDQIVRALGGATLFEVLFVFQRAPLDLPRAPRLTLAPVGVEQGAAKIDLTFSFVESAAHIDGIVEYASDLFQPEEVERSIRRLELILAEMIARPQVSIAAIPLATKEEQLELERSNATARPDLLERSLLQAIERAASRDPQAIAAEHRGAKISYGELWQKVRCFARYLRDQGVGPEQLVGVACPPSIELLIALVGTLYRGAAYVPVAADRSVAERQQIAARLGLAQLISVETVRASSVLEPFSVPSAPPESSLAYVMDTSGSTGVAKSVAVSRRALANAVFSISERITLRPGDTWLAVSALIFDISALELFAPLVCGAKVVLADSAITRDGAALKTLFEEIDPSVMQATPSTWRMLLEAGWQGSAKLRVLCGGEAMSRSLSELLLDRCGGLWNMYGPTETTIWSSVTKIERGAAIGIGAPIANTELFVAGDRGELAPNGLAGELWIGGAGVARGYLGQPALTAERFVPHPWSNDPGARLYRTGDLVRRKPDGTLEWLSRRDRQLKIRGVLLDPTQIERALEAHPAIAEAAVIADGDPSGEQRLLGYYLQRSGSEISPKELKVHLASSLPPLMIPAHLIALETFPRTANGKLDRRSLQAASPGLFTPEIELSRPATPWIEVLGGLWAEVLGLERVAAEANFFDLGGHSLLSTRLIARIRDALGVELPLRVLFEAPVLGDFSARFEAVLRQRSGLADKPPLSRSEAAATLSFGQERLWFLEQLEPGTALFNIPSAVRLRGDLEVERLRRAFAEVIERHEVLRTVYPEENGAPRPVLIEGDHTVPLVDLALIDRRLAEEALQLHAAALVRAPFDLARGPLIRAALFRLSSDEHLIVLAVHHIAMDAPSMDLLARELAAFYSEKSGISAPELPVQYGDFARWQRAWLDEQKIEQLLGYWRRQLAGATLELWPVLGDRRRTFEGGTVPFHLEKEVAQQLRLLARQERATLFMVLLAALDTLLYRHTGETDLLVGAPATHRGQSELEPLIGFFVNTLVLRADLAGDPTFLELLRRVRETCLAAYEHQDLPYEVLVADLKPAQRLAPLFQVLLIVHNVRPRPLLVPGLELIPETLDTKTAHFDLTLTVIDAGADLEGTIEYDTGLFEAATMQRMARAFEHILRAVAKDPALPIGAVPLGPAQRIEVVPEPELDPRPVHRLFEAQAARAPDRSAVIDAGGTAWTYRQLDRRANAIAHFVRKKCGGPEPRIGITCRRSPELIAAILGVLKAGAAYVPIDRALPQDRVERIKEDAAIELILDDVFLAAGEVADRPPPVADHPARAAYLIYTSGTTGVPAGVVVEHRSLGAFAQATRRAFGISASDRVLQFASLSWDTSAEEIYPALICGGVVALRGEQMVESIAAFCAGCRALEVTLADLPTSFWHELVRELERGSIALPPSLRTIVIGGERALPDRIRAWNLSAGAGVKLLNSYGATELTAISTTIDLSEAPIGAHVPIGRAVEGVRAYVLDTALQPVPEEISGELYVGGSGVARGYLRRSARTAEKFLPDPFSPVPGARMYRTGDRVRVKNGALEYLGRRDQQVKIRGHRVELAEIEAVLASHPEVIEAAVIASQVDGETRLAAHVATNLRAADVRAYSRQKLPPYMIPELIHVAGVLPKNSSGKLDRRALADRPFEPEEKARVMRRPLTPDETLLQELWCEVLGKRGIGADEDFFDLGGHSLRATRLIAAVRDVFEVDLPLRDIFEAPTIALLAERIARARGKNQPPPQPIQSLPRNGWFELSPAQERVWFLDRLSGTSALFNMPVGLHFRGALSIPALISAIEASIERHELLRGRYPERSGRPMLAIEREVAAEIPVVDLRSLPEAARAAEGWRIAAELARAPIDLAVAPPLRFAAVQLAEEEWGLLAIVHHIACDAWSLDVLSRELDELYRAKLEGRQVNLPPLAIQYADYAAWQRRELAGPRGEAALARWIERLNGISPLVLPLDRARRPGAFRGAAQVRLVDRALSDQVRLLARSERASFFMTFLASFTLLLHRYSGQDDIVVGSPTTNRGRSELQGLIGFFVNMLVLRIGCRPEQTFRELLAEVRSVCLSAYEDHQVPFEQIVERLRPDRDLAKNPLFQVGFGLNDARDLPARIFGQEVTPLAIETGTTKFDLSLAVLDTAEGFVTTFEYNAELFEAQSISRLAEHFFSILQAVSNNPVLPLSRTQLLSEEERARSISAGARAPLPEMTVDRLVSEAAAKNPEAPAVTIGGETISYGVLEKRAAELAAELRARVEEGAIVAVELPRSIELIVALLAVAKAGAAYLPLDPQLPRERREAMIDDASPALILTTSGILESARKKALQAADLFYVIYTSGSTGVPKGVMNAHRPLVNRLSWMQRALAIGPGDRVLAKTSIGFDVSVWEMFLPLVSGAELVLLPPGEEKDPPAITRRIEEHRISVLHFVPSALATWLDTAPISGPSSLRSVVTSGETLARALADRFYERIAGVALYNYYGPTEAAIDVTAELVEPRSDLGSVPIGRPIDNVAIYVLEASLEPAPIGVAGELYIGGIAPARGYLGKPAPTAATFLPDPFSDLPGARMYRTGDRARRLADGRIDHLGRIDRQLKIRGLRIEPQEIEQTLLEDRRIREARVVLRSHPSGERLVAYFVAQNDDPPRPRELARRLKRKLPEQAVPAFFVPLDAFRLNNSGKIDLAALPPESPDHAARAVFEPPRPGVEEELAVMWRELLGIERIGIHDNFFELGGHSLLLTRLAAKIAAAFSVELPLARLFDEPTIAGITEMLAADLASQTSDEELLRLLEEVGR